MNVKTSSYVIVDTFKMLNSYMEHVATVLDNSDTEHFHTTESSTRHHERSDPCTNEGYV